MERAWLLRWLYAKRNGIAADMALIQASVEAGMGDLSPAHGVFAGELMIVDSLIEKLSTK